LVGKKEEKMEMALKKIAGTWLNLEFQFAQQSRATMPK
jgi:hypothetical protein